MDIKVEIALSSTTLALENEDIISLYTSFRSTSKPSEPTYGAFASDGSIVIRDNNLDLFKRAQNGEFDKFNYPVTISLKNEETGNFEAISTQIINRRPTYNYADKTLSIQLSDKIDSMDNLVYEGYPYNLEAETAYDIILDLLTKFWDGTKALACLSANAYGTTTFASIFQDITIQYPYIAPQTTYRAAFSSVLSLAHCALICNENGNPRLIYLDKTTAEVEDTEVAVLTADKTQEAFTTSVILDNKFDNAQVQATRVSSKIETGEITTFYNNDITISSIENLSFNAYEYNDGNRLLQATPQGDGYFYSSITGNNLYYKKYTQLLEISQYQNNKFDDILSLKQLEQDNFNIILKQKIKIYQSTVTPFADYSFGGAGYVQNADFPNDNTYTILKSEDEKYVTLGQEDLTPQSIYYSNNAISYYGWAYRVNNEGTPIKIYYNYSPIIYPVFNYNNNEYSVELNYAVGKHIEYYCLEGQLNSVNNEFRGYLTAYKYIIDEEPVSIEIGINGVKRTINLENIKAVGEGSIDNVAEVNTYGKLLQYGLNISNPNVANEIEHITDYYENGLHTANMTVLGGVGYNSLGVETITETITEVTFEDVYYGDFTVMPLFTAQILLQNGQGNPNYTSTITTALKDIIMSSNERINFVYSTSSITYRGTVIDNNTQNKFIRFYGAYQYTAEQGSSTVRGNYSYIISFNFNTNRVTEDLTVSFTNVAVSGYYYNLISYISGQIRLQMSNDFNFSWAGIGDKKIETETIITHDVPVPYDNDKQVFACGEYVTVKNYDNESPLYYRETEVPLQWQITENKITFDGGAVTQALTLKELKKQT